MKTLWSTVTILALANMLALVGFVGWLGMSDRLSPERAREIRAILAPTVTEAEAIAAEAAAQAAADEAAAAEARRQADPPLTPTAVLARREVTMDVAAQEVLRVRQEVRERQADLDRQVAELAMAQAAFAEERAAWQAQREAEAERVDGEQFAKLVELFSAMKPRDAKSLMMEMEARGEREEIVRLLDALPIRTATKVLAELKSPAERTLASVLLSRLRDLGRELPGTDAPVEPAADVDPLEQSDG